MTYQDLRQHVTVSTHLSRDLGFEFRPEVWPADADQPIARVEVIRGLGIQSDDASILRELADAFTRAAASIEALQPSLCTSCGRELHDEDPSNTGLGHHVDCTLDGALAGQPA